MHIKYEVIMSKQYILFVFILMMYTFIYSAQQVDFIVAKVGRDVILYSDLSKQILQMQSAKMWDDSMTQDLILTDMVESKLIVQKAKDLNIRIDERRVKSMAESQISQMQSRYPSQGDFYRELRSAGLTVSELRAYYENALTEQQLKERLIQSEIKNKINITDNDAYEYFFSNLDKMPLREESFELAMIVRKPQVSPETERKARSKIVDIRNRIQKGENFASLARSYSEDPGSAQFGGDIGYFSRGQMVKEFEEVAFETGINEISGIVKTVFGYHIIMVTDKTQDEVKASHILIQIAETAEDTQRELDLMNSLHQRILDGEDFAELAKQYSQDEDSKEQNGVIGTFTKSQYPIWFTDTLSLLNIGEVSEVLEHQNIFYLFKINQSFPPRAVEFEEIKDNIRNQLSMVKQMELYERWIEDLKTEIFVTIYKDRLNRSN